MTQPTFISLHQYSQAFPYNAFAIKQDRCVGGFNTLNELSNKVCVPQKTEDLDLSVLNIITGINESKTLTKQICECKCRFDRRKCNSDQWWNHDKSWSECEKCHVCEKVYVWDPSACNCEIGKYLASIIDDSTIMCDEVIESFYEETKTVPTIFNEKIHFVKHKISIFYMHFY